ncbi:hypothetical protein JI435_405230 [Parastagonospora nodorum SN15]|nr:hypothetical protein JI435_405230 [Parastagonospora nodorum SN15]
MSHFSYH